MMPNIGQREQKMELRLRTIEEILERDKENYKNMCTHTEYPSNFRLFWKYPCSISLGSKYNTKRFRGVSRCELKKK